MINLFIIMYTKHRNTLYHHISSLIPYSHHKGSAMSAFFHFPTQNQLFLTPTSCSKNCHQTNTHYFLPLYEVLPSPIRSGLFKLANEKSDRIALLRHIIPLHHPTPHLPFLSTITRIALCLAHNSPVPPSQTSTPPQSAPAAWGTPSQ